MYSVTKINNRQLGQVFTDPESFSTTMILVLVDVYGTEVFTWAPETIKMEIEDDFSIKMPVINFDRLMAGVALVTSDRFYKSLPDFIDLCNILSGAAAHPGIFDIADAGECAWGITEALLLSPPDTKDQNPFTKEICAYVGKMLDMEGIIEAPDILRIAVREKDLKAKIHNDFSDDPEMYSAIWSSERDKTDDINQMVKDRLFAMITQVSMLQLANGDVSDMSKKMLDALNKQSKE